MASAVSDDNGAVAVSTPQRDVKAIRESGFPIVGIGASAGGLEAFTELLKALPTDTGMAFVVVQHLAPTHESMLTELLSNATDLPVTEVTDGMRVRPNHVYVIPPNTSMGIMDGMLHLVPRSGARGQHMPIDIFLHSLAEDQKTRAIGVILSGTASDGALGLQAIKTEGGITLVQEPSTARYDGMPRSAIAAGAVDVVLPVEGIARELAKIGRHPYVIEAPAPEVVDPPVGDDHIRRILHLIKVSSGSDFTYYKHATIHRRIRRRMVLQKIEQISDYVKHLQQNPAELDQLYQDILIHVTGFFRDAETFDALKAEILPKIIEQRRGESPIRIWIPGCSTGEEAYSFAIALLEVLGDSANNTPIQIFATDISQQAIEKARTGFYSESVAGDLSQERLRRYFSKSDGGYRISKTIRDLCIFARQDVTKDPPFSKMDLISCRNLLIYLGPPLQKRVLSVFHYSLKPGGYLILGPSESIGPFAEYFSAGDKNHKFYFRKTALARSSHEFQPEYTMEHVREARRGPVRNARADVPQEIDRIIMNRYAPAGVVVDSDLQVLHARGEIGKYLQPAQGQASLNLLKMAREGLGLELRTAIHAARKKKEPIRKLGLKVKQNGHIGRVNVEVLPIDLVVGEKHYLVVFHDAEAAPPSPAAKAAERKRGSSSRTAQGELRRLEQELDTTREYLQSIIQDHEAFNEELQSANEEILSSNEELQSTNEELETAKEELQSTNEELSTVNEELQTRNQEMREINSDLNNLLASVQMPILMVSTDLRIRRFTPMIERIFNIIPGDVGRPITDFKPNLKISNLESLIYEVIDTVSVKEVEVQNLEGRWYSLRLRPYKSIENKIDGAVLALVDIDAIKTQRAGSDSSENSQPT